MQQDQVTPFTFETLPLRGVLIQLSATWKRMLRGHRYDRPVRETLAHAAAATGLIASSLKFDGAVTLQIQGQGPLRMLVVQCTSDLKLRGMATAHEPLVARSFADLTAKATCAVTLDAGDRPYQGIVEIATSSLAGSLENYFNRSVQLPSDLVLRSGGRHCGGLLLQQMPGAASLDANERLRLRRIAARLRLADLAALTGIELIGALFAGDDVRVYESRPVCFGCRCSRERVEQVLRLLGRDEAGAALAERGHVEVVCEYCGQARRLDAIDIARLFGANVADASPALH